MTYASKLQNKALSLTVSAIILFGSVAGIIALYAVWNYPCRLCGGATQVFPAVDSVNFTSKTNTFSFKLSTPDNFINATLTNVTLNDTACNGNYPPIEKSETLMLSCVATQMTFKSGQIVTYYLNFTGGESITGYMTAQ